MSGAGKSDVECIWPLAAQLAEGPIWSAQEQAVWFVDIKGRRIHRYREPSGELRSWDAPQEIGFIVPVCDASFIAGLRTGLHRFDPQTGSFELLTRIDSDRPGNRLNDACVDHAGRLWFGSIDNAEERVTGALYRFDMEGLRRCDDGYVITNGPAVCPAGRTLYHIDTLQRVIYAFDLDRTGSVTNRRVFARIDVADAYPDGPVVDASGCIWVGLFGGWGLQR